MFGAEWNEAVVNLNIYPCSCKCWILFQCSTWVLNPCTSSIIHICFIDCQENRFLLFKGLAWETEILCNLKFDMSIQSITELCIVSLLFFIFTCVHYTQITPLLCKFLLSFQWIIFHECTGSSFVCFNAIDLQWDWSKQKNSHVHSPMTVSVKGSFKGKITNLKALKAH